MDTTILIERAVALLDPLSEVGKKVSSARRKKLEDALQMIRDVLAEDNPAEDAVSADAAESASVEIEGECIPLIEAVRLRADGTVPVKLIQAGWGSTGFYGADMLKRDGPKVFVKGLHMHLDHPTKSEERERPERSVATLAGVLESDARWEEAGADGPGLYADAKPLGEMKDRLPEIAPHIGLSIRAMGGYKEGEVEGRKGKIIEGITSATSVDFVTRAGAGGKVLALMESLRESRPILTTKAANAAKEKIVTEAEAQALREANAALVAEQATLVADVARLKETIVLGAARELVSARLAESKLPDITRARLAVSLVASPIVTDGALDADAYGQAITEAIRVESEYVAFLTGAGQIKGLGTTGAPAFTSNLKETWKKLYLKQGHSVEEAEKMAASAAG